MGMQDGTGRHGRVENVGLTRPRGDIERELDIANDVEFAKCTNGRETRSQATCGATQYDDSILERLGNPI